MAPARGDVNLRVAFLSAWRQRRAGHQGFEGLVRPHVPEMYRLAFRLTGRREDAEDVVQAVLTRLYPDADALASKDNLRSWLLRVVHNEFVDHWRRYRRGPVPESEMPGMDPGEDAVALGEQMEGGIDGAEEAERSELQQQLSSAMYRLSEEHRAVLAMHDVEGYSMIEIAEMTGVAVGTVKSRLHRARSQMRMMLDEGHGTFLELRS
jgi:RNA polymerase sigma factor (sigma-70 family)